MNSTQHSYEEKNAGIAGMI